MMENELVEQDCLVIIKPPNSFSCSNFEKESCKQGLPLYIVFAHKSSK